jgi:hypothetical protein
LIPDEAGERWALRGWLADDCEHTTRAVLANRYTVKDALHFLIGCALGHAERAHMAPDMAHAFAVEMFWERLHDLEARNGATGFPFSEREVASIVAGELQWAMPRLGGRHGR